MITFVTGGARSGKSGYEESLLLDETEVTYIATAEVFGEEMRDRVEKHQKRRPEAWKTWESPRSLKSCPYSLSHVLLDCLTLFTTNIFFSCISDENCVTPEEMAMVEERVIGEVQDFIHRVREVNGDLIIVSNEIGMGIVPENHLARVFRDVQGRVNQAIAKESDRVVLVVSGIPVEVKG